MWCGLIIVASDRKTRPDLPTGCRFHPRCSSPRLRPGHRSRHCRQQVHLNPLAILPPTTAPGRLLPHDGQGRCPQAVIMPIEKSHVVGPSRYRMLASKRSSSERPVAMMCGRAWPRVSCQNSASGEPADTAGTSAAMPMSPRPFSIRICGVAAAEVDVGADGVGDCLVETDERVAVRVVRRVRRAEVDAVDQDQPAAGTNPLEEPWQQRLAIAEVHEHEARVDEVELARVEVGAGDVALEQGEVGLGWTVDGAPQPRRRGPGWRGCGTRRRCPRRYPGIG